MKLWVIGSKGMLGSALIQLCRQWGIDAVGTFRQQADITSVSDLMRNVSEIQPSHIVNCAAYTDVDQAEREPEIAYAINAEGAKNVAQVAREVGAHLLHLSTDYVFDGKSSRPYREDDLCEPVNVYGKSKRDGELAVLQSFPNACILRTSWLFGARGKNFISSIFHWLQQKEQLQVVIDQCGKPTYCLDVAQAVLSLLNVEGIVHFANEEERSRYQIAIDIFQAAKKKGYPLKCENIFPINGAQFPTPAKRPSYSVLDTSKYHLLTNLRPRAWSEVINEFLDHAYATL